MSGITYSLGLTVTGFRSGLAAASSLVHGFRGTATGAFSAVAASARKVSDILFKLPDQVRALQGITSTLGLPVKLAADAETLAVSLRVLVGSAQVAEDVLNRLRTLAATTPFEFPELADGARKLIAFGEAADTVHETLRRIGDVASAVGAPIGEIAEIYGKARVQGQLFAEDINQLTGRGIPVMQQFAKSLGVGVEKVKQMASEGKLTFTHLEDAFRNLTDAGGQFYGMMAEQSATLNGMWSTFTDTVKTLAVTLGQPLLGPLKDSLVDATKWAETLAPLAERIGTELARWANLIRVAVSQGQIGELLSASLIEGAAVFLDYLAAGLTAAARNMGEEIADLGTQLRDMFIASNPVRKIWDQGGEKVKAEQRIKQREDGTDVAGKSMKEHFADVMRDGGPLGDWVKQSRIDREKITGSLQVESDKQEAARNARADEDDAKKADEISHAAAMAKRVAGAKSDADVDAKYNKLGGDAVAQKLGRMVGSGELSAETLTEGDRNMLGLDIKGKALPKEALEGLLKSGGTSHGEMSEAALRVLGVDRTGKEVKSAPGGYSAGGSMSFPGYSIPGIPRADLPGLSMRGMSPVQTMGGAVSGAGGEGGRRGPLSKLDMLRNQFARQRGSGEGAVGWSAFVDRQVGFSDRQRSAALRAGPKAAGEAAERMGNTRSAKEGERSGRDRTAQEEKQKQGARDQLLRGLVTTVQRIEKHLAEEETI